MSPVSRLVALHVASDSQALGGFVVKQSLSQKQMRANSIQPVDGLACVSASLCVRLQGPCLDTCVCVSQCVVPVQESQCTRGASCWGEAAFIGGMKNRSDLVRKRGPVSARVRLHGSARRRRHRVGIRVKVQR